VDDHEPLPGRPNLRMLARLRSSAGLSTSAGSKIAVDATRDGCSGSGSRTSVSFGPVLYIA